nr:outer membrane beta-barrel family protein [Rhodothermaceae bacterium]
SAEDLVTKLPGVVMQDGQVEAQGEQVQRVTVDGREFFGDDPTVALRNMPAEVIQSIEIIDEQSEQAQFTGFSDGETQKTINIVTRTGMSNGRFGKIYGGYGDEERYISGGNGNIFDGDRRISIIGLSNNVNQQNFAFEDLLGISGGNSRGGPSRGMRGSGPPRRGSGGGGRRGRGGNGFSPRDFLVGQQGGLNNTTSAGLNYSDEFGSKVKLSTSYFFNRMGNTNDTSLDRQLFLPGDQAQFYNESTYATSTNFNHRLNARIEYTIDENNSLLIRPRLSFQDNRATNRVSGINILDTGSLLNEAFNDATSNNNGYTSSASVLYRHRFPKRGRTISTEFDMGLNDRWGDTDQFLTTAFFDQDLAAGDSTYDQQIDSETASSSFGLDIDYTEPLGEDGQLRISYEPSIGKNVSDRFAYVLDLQTGLYTIVDPTFSSLFDNDVFRQRGGITYRQNIGERFELQLGVEAQNERLLGDQTFPVAYDLDRSFFTILPEIELEYEIDEKLDLDLDYSARTNTPSVSQLQDVIDNTNPLFLSSGNPELEPSYEHSIRLRARRGNWREGRMLFGYINFSHERNSIGTASLLAVRDTTLARGIVLQQGSQFSQPVNLADPSINVRSFFGIGTPFSLIKSNLNFRGGFTYSRTPGLINGTVNTATLYALNGGLTIASNISERLDFTASYRADYTIASNSFYEELDENYFRHNANLRFTWLSTGGLVAETSLVYNDYLQLDEELYPTTFIMNAGLGYKFMQQEAAEIKLVVGDIFNQETGLNRSITELYVEDRRTQVLGRYILLNLSYRFRDFGF